jgi:hypothetical protein
MLQKWPLLRRIKRQLHDRASVPAPAAPHFSIGRLEVPGEPLRVHEGDRSIRERRVRRNSRAHPIRGESRRDLYKASGVDAINSGKSSS